jgi:Helix-turn-helix domain
MTWLTPPQLAAECGLEAQKICDWIAAGELIAVNVAQKTGGRPRWRIRVADWEAFLASRQNVKPPRERARKRKPEKLQPYY